MNIWINAFITMKNFHILKSEYWVVHCSIKKKKMKTKNGNKKREKWQISKIVSLLIMSHGVIYPCFLIFES